MKNLTTVALIAFLVSCADDSSFKANVNTKKIEPSKAAEQIPEPPSEMPEPLPEPVPIPDPILPVASKVTKALELKTTTTSSPIDMVWVVDNSGSMAQEVAQVRANIQAFAKSVASRSDLKLSIISNKNAQLGLSLDPATLPMDFLQVEDFVGSLNAMAMLAASICPKEGTVATPTTLTHVCGKEVTNSRGTGADSDLQAAVVAGKLKDRLREGSTKVFVFVSDDDAIGTVTGANFLSLTGLDPTRTHSYAFAGLVKKAGCSIARVGTSYKSLATATGGEVFDICELDWSENFAKLTEKVLKLTANTFNLLIDVESLKSVKIGELVLTPAQYTYSKGRLVVLDDSLLKEGDTIFVEYEVEE